MANELTALTEFTGRLFRYSYMFLPWFARNFKGVKYQVDQYDKVVDVVEVLKEDGCAFFGDGKEMAEANEELKLFYEALKPRGTIKSNQDAVEHYRKAWKLAFKKRNCLQLRGYESKMLKYFNEIIGGAEHTHLPELQSIARVVSSEVINIAKVVGERTRISFFLCPAGGGVEYLVYFETVFCLNFG